MLQFFQKRSHLSAHTWLWLILILAVALRLPHLNGSFWLDEAAQALESARPLSQQLDIIPDFQPPLIHILTHFALYFSPAEWWLRLWAAFLPGLVTIWATYQIGKKLHSSQLGAIAALLLATNSFHIFYSQELRPYSLPTMFAVLSWLSLLHWFENLGSKKALVMYTLLTIGGLYSSYLYPFALLSQLGVVLFQYRSLFKTYLLSLFASVVAFLPWLPLFFQQLAKGQSWRVELPGWETVVSFTQLKSLPLVLGKFIFGVLDLELTLGYLVVFAVVLGSISMVLFRLAQQQKLNPHQLHKPWGQRWLILSSALLIPLLTSWLISFWVPVVQPKRVLFVLPFFYLLIVDLCLTAKSQPSNVFQRFLALFDKRWKHQWVYLPIIMLLGINLFSTGQYFTQEKYQRENWRQLVAQIERQFPPNETVILFSFDVPFAPWRWYAGTTYPTVVTGELSIQDVKDLPNQLKVVTTYQYVLVFDYLRDLTDPHDLTLQTLKDFGYTEVGALDQTNIGFIRIYAQPNNLLSQTLELN